jgi:hypothetical protein
MHAPHHPACGPSVVRAAYHTTTLQVCIVVHEIQRVRSAPRTVDVYDEAASSAVCEMCLSLCDMRAILVEVVCQLDLLQNAAELKPARRQVLAAQVRVGCVFQLLLESSFDCVRTCVGLTPQLEQPSCWGCKQ